MKTDKWKLSKFLLNKKFKFKENDQNRYKKF